LTDFFRTAWLVLRKDFAIEVTSREILYTTLVFAVSCILVFSFAFVSEGGQPLPGAAAGILWIAMAFSGTLALGRTFDRERYGDTVRALLLAPAPRSAIYFGKLLGMVALMLGTEVVVVPLVALLFHVPLFDQLPLVVCLLVPGTIGFAAVGTLFAAMLIRAQTRGVMLWIVLFPITVPVLIAGVRGTSALLDPMPETAVATMWIGLLAAFDAVFLTLALWTFEPVMTE
jgi:heme exporter protein CcmB